MRHDVTFQLTSPTAQFDGTERAGMALMGLGFLSWLMAVFGIGVDSPVLVFWVGLIGIAGGAMIYFRRYLKRPSGINNDGLWLNAFTRE